jgi:hypothetical protein
MNEKKSKILHGNKAKIDPAKSISPQFVTAMLNNDRYGRNGRAFHRLDSDDIAEFNKSEVDANQL